MVSLVFQNELPYHSILLFTDLCPYFIWGLLNLTTID